MANYTDTFLRIPFNFFNSTDIDNLFTKVGTKGFFLYSYLLYSQGNKKSCEISIGTIQTFLNRDFDNRPEVKYSKTKKYKIELVKEKETIVKFLSLLHKNELINVNDIVFSEKNTSKININKTLVIECNKFMDSQFIAIPESLYFDKICKMGHVGFSILCLLAKLFNKDYGSLSCEGFANPTQEYISAIIKRDIDTVRAYSYLLQELKLIKITNQDPVFKGEDYKGKQILECLPNNYEVKFKLVDNKYYIEGKDVKKET